jgi:hypothetical protein
MFPSGSYNLILIISKPTTIYIASTYLQCPDKYIWDESSISRFQSALSSVSVTSKIKNFQNMSFENKHNSVDIALDDVIRSKFGLILIFILTAKLTDTQQWSDSDLIRLFTFIKNNFVLKRFTTYYIVNSTTPQGVMKSRVLYWYVGTLMEGFQHCMTLL